MKFFSLQTVILVCFAVPTKAVETTSDDRASMRGDAKAPQKNFDKKDLVQEDRHHLRTRHEPPVSIVSEHKRQDSAFERSLRPKHFHKDGRTASGNIFDKNGPVNMLLPSNEFIESLTENFWTEFALDVQSQASPCPTPTLGDDMPATLVVA